ncbi:MAG: hypothetical protein ACP5M8_01255 [Caldisphaera sp.]
MIFYGNLESFVKPLLPFSYDNISAIIAGIILFVIAERSAYLTEELQTTINALKEP